MRGFRQDEPLSFKVLYFASAHLLVYAALTIIKLKSANMGLSVNGDKIKGMFLRSIYLLHIGSKTTAGNYTFDVVSEFVYHDSTVKSKK